MTAEHDEDYISDEQLLAELPDPFADEDYVEATEKLQALQDERDTIVSKIDKTKKQLTKLDVEDSESADKAAKLDRRLDQLIRKSERLTEAITYQTEAVDTFRKQAKRNFQAHARRLWENEYVPELVELIDRLAEIRDIYKTLKTQSGGNLKPPFPTAFHNAIGKDAIWLKRRKQHWFEEMSA